MIEERTKFVDIPIDRGFIPKTSKRKGVVVNKSMAQMIASLVGLKLGETYLLYPKKKDTNMEHFLEKVRSIYKEKTGYDLKFHGLLSMLSRDKDCVIVLKT